MACLSPFAQALLVAGLLAPPLASSTAAEDLARLRQELARQTDPAQRATLTVKLGEELLRQAAKMYEEGAYTDGDLLLDEYRQAIRAAHLGLRQSGRDARSHPKGFKQLEIHLRKSRRRLEDLARVVPFENRPPLEEAMTEIETVRTELLEALMKVDRKAASPEPERKQQP